LWGTRLCRFVYVTGMGTGIAVRMETCDGYLTMLPQRLTINGAALDVAAGIDDEAQ